MSSTEAIRHLTKRHARTKIIALDARERDVVVAGQ